MGTNKPPRQHNVFFSDDSESDEEMEVDSEDDLGANAQRIESKTILPNLESGTSTESSEPDNLDSEPLSSVATSGELEQDRLKEFDDFTPELKEEFHRLTALDYKIRTYESNGDYRAIQNLLETEDNKTLINKFRGHPTVEKFIDRFDNALIKTATQRPGPGPK